MAVYEGGVAIVRARADGSRLAGDISKSMNSPALKGAALSAGKVLGAALAVGVAVDLTRKFIDAAADEVEALNKVKVVFEESAHTVEAFGETSAKAFGISQTAALQAAGAFGQLLQAGGVAEQASADMSVTLVKLAADLASFNNIGTDEALEKIQSGLAGMARPLREVGVFLSAARVEQEAYTSGIAEFGAELTDAQKIQARYNIILQDTKKAQGDFQRTLGVSLPNQLRVLEASLHDVAATLGKALLPVALDVVTALTKLAPLLVTIVPLVIKLGVALLAWKALKFIPELLLGIASGLEAIGAAGLAGKILSVAAGMSSLLGTLATAAPLALTFAGAFVGLTAALATWDPLGIVNQDELNKQLEEGDLIVGKFKSSVIGLGPAASAGIGPVRTGLNYAADAFTNLREAAATVPEAVREVGRAGHSMSRDFRAAIAETTRVTVGQFKNMKEAFQTTPVQLRNALNAAVNVARQYQRDIKAIMSDKSLTDEQKKALLQLEPEFRHAFVKAGEGAKQELAKKAVELKRLNANKFGEMVNEGKAKLSTGGHAQGAAYMRGLSLGISANAGVARAAASRVAHQILEDVNAALGIESPSKEGAKQGELYIDGIVQGMNRRLSLLGRIASKVSDALREAIDRTKTRIQAFLDKGLAEAVGRARRHLETLRADLHKAMDWEHDLRKAERDLDRLVDRLHDFRGAIRSGFDELKDLAGIVGDLFKRVDEQGNPVVTTAEDITKALQQQVADAQQLASLLQQAAGAGLSQNLVAQFAGQGAAAIPALQALLANPELIAQMNAAAAAINQAAGDTADALGDRFFGRAIKDAARDVRMLSRSITEFIRGLAQMFKGTEVGDALRALLNQFKEARNPVPTGAEQQPNGQPHPFPWETPPILTLPRGDTFIINGTIVNEDDWWGRVDEGLAKRRRRNGRLALEGV